MSNTHHNKKSFLYAISIFIFFSFCSCSQAKESYKKTKYGENSNYFLGLREKEEGNEIKAKNYFDKCIKKGDEIFVRKCLEEFCSIGDVQEKISAAKNLVAKYEDDKALLIAAKIFSENNEPNLLISITDKIDLKKSDNELIRLRLEAKKKTWEQCVQR